MAVGGPLEELLIDGGDFSGGEPTASEREVGALKASAVIGLMARALSRPDAFVSYAHEDRDWVVVLVQKLNKETVGSRHLHVVMDETAFVPGKSLSESIERGVRTAEKLICVLSPDFLESDWTALEYQIKLLDDPAGRKGLIVPILYRECDVPYRLRIRLAADFRKQDNHERAYRRLLVALGVGTTTDTKGKVSQGAAERLPSPSYLSSHTPDPTSETLALNAFRVIRAPECIWSAETPFRTYQEIEEAIDGKPDLAYTFHSERVWTFCAMDQKEFPLSAIIDKKTIRKSSIKSMISDNETRNLVIEVFNKTLTHDLRKKGLRFDRRYGRYYFPPDHGKKRVVAWPGLKRTSKRTVTIPRYRPDGSLRYFEHLAAVLRFAKIGDDFYLLVVPTWTLTEDGYKPIRGPGVGPKIAKKTRKIYNNLFWLEVMFWLHQLKWGGKIMVNAGPTGPDIEIDGYPPTTTVGSGIFGDSLSMFKPDYIERWHAFAPKLEEEAEMEEDDDSKDDMEGDVE
ncbi:MAG: toll/interleukin-1 receptor domain-containing protein [Halobacteria archaeon]